MLNKKYIFGLFLIFIVTLGIFISSCDISNPTDGLEVILNNIQRETLVSVSFYDANTGDAISQKVSVTFSGANAAYISDQSNTSTTSFTAEDGFLIFAVKDGTMFDKNNPFRVIVNLSSPGFDSKTEVIELLAKGIQTFDLNLVNPATLPADTDQGTADGTTNSSGTTAAPIVINTNGGTNVNIPSGSTLTTSSGTPLVGNVTAKIVSVPITTANINYAPKDISISSSYSVKPAASINLSVKGQSGNSANIDVQSTIPITAGITNPTTGADYKEGDVVESYAFNPATGFYEKVGEGTISSTSQVRKNSLGKTKAGLKVTITVRAGSNTILGASETTCTVDFTVTGAPANFNFGALKFVKYDGTEISANGYGQGTYTTKIPSTGGTAVNATFNGTNVGSANLTCSGATIVLNLPANFVNRDFVIQGICTKNGQVTKMFITTPFRYKKSSATRWNSAATNGNGIVLIGGLEVGATYYISASYTTNNKTYSGTGEMTITVNGISMSNLSDPEVLKSASNGLTTILEFDVQDNCN